MVRRHERFALTDVSYAGVAIGSATVDVWESSAGAVVWCARVLVAIGDLPTNGPFAGMMRDGRLRSGQCHVGNGVLGPMSRSKQIVELLGEGSLQD